MSLRNAFPYRVGLAVSFAATLVAPAGALAGTVVQCGADVCAQDFSIFFDGAAEESGGGRLLYDAKSGAISLDKAPAAIRGGGFLNPRNELMWRFGAGEFVTVGGLNGNADPILGFSVAAGTGSAVRSFAFVFDLPIALPDLPVDVVSQASYSLTATGPAGGQITPLGTHVIEAFDIDTDIGGIGSVDKGVAIGDTFFLAPGPGVANSPVYGATNTFLASSALDLMSVRLSFALTPDTQVGISGFVSQTPVPVPGAVWLLGSAALALVGFRRRRA